MSPQASGKYEFVEGENYDAYLKACGLTPEQTEIGLKLKPTIEVSQNGEEWTVELKTEVFNKKFTFKEGVEFSDTTPSGKTIKTVIRKEGDKLTQTQMFENGFQPTMDLEFTEKGLKVSYAWPEGKAVRQYKRV